MRDTAEVFDHHPLDAEVVVEQARSILEDIPGSIFAKLTAHNVDGVMLRDLGSHEGSLVNGWPTRSGLLRPGDQVVFDAHHRFVVEAPSVSSWHAASVGEARAAAELLRHEIKVYIGSSVEVSASPAAFLTFMKAETAKWAKVIQLAGVKAD